MKRIAVVSHGTSGGGAERVSTILANYLVDQGYEVYFYAVYSDKRGYYLNEKIHYEYCSVTGRIGLVRQIQRCFKVRKFILKNKIETMYSFLGREAMLLVGNHKLKKIHSLRNDPNRVFNKGFQKIIRDVVYADADNVVFQTPDGRVYFSKKIQEKGVVIPNPLKPDLPYWNPEKHEKVIIAAGRLDAQKNFQMLLEAFEMFSEKIDGYILRIFGDGELKEELKNYAESLGIGNKVEFPGFSNDIHQKMIESEIYVSSSDYEGVSNSMLEALAIGIPSVCTDCPVGGPKMFIQDGKSGFLTPVGDAQKLAQKLIILAEDKELQKKFSKSSVAIREVLDVETICNEWLKLV